jgi:hypothetical protein
MFWGDIQVAIVLNGIKKYSNSSKKVFDGLNND